MSAAYHLSKSGCSEIIVIEKDTVGSGTTYYSLGGFRHQYSTNSNIRFSIESIKFLQNFEKLFGIGSSIRNDGYLFLASSEQETAELERQVAAQRNFGIEALILTPDEIGQICPYLNLDGIIGGSFGPTDGHADTSAVLQGYTRGSLNNGVSIQERTEVTGFEYERNNRRISSITTTAGTIVPDQVLICDGPYTLLI